MKMAQVMKSTTDVSRFFSILFLRETIQQSPFQTMTAMNKQIDPMKVAKTMQEFEKANTKMEMSEEMSECTFCLSGILGLVWPLSWLLRHFLEGAMGIWSFSSPQILQHAFLFQ